MAITPSFQRGSTGVVLPEVVSNEIWGRMAEASVVQRVARKLPTLPAGGATVYIITDDGSAAWVDESAEKPVSNMTLANKKIKGYKMARILTFSNEFQRDLSALYNELVPRAAASLGRLFDQTVFGYVAAPGSNFDTLAASPTAQFDDSTTLYSDLLAGLSTVSAADGDVSAWIIDSRAEITALGALDGNARPLFTLSPNNDGIGSIGSLLGRPVIKSRNVYNNPTEAGTDVTGDTVGFGGSWAEDAAWGYASPISIRYSDQATLNIGGTARNLWQRNEFALLVECELGFRVSDDDRFIRLRGAVTQ